MHEQQLIDIETKLVYQEDHIQGLNKSLHDMQRQIDSLELTCQTLKEKMRDLEKLATIEINDNEKPPHY